MDILAQEGDLSSRYCILGMNGGNVFVSPGRAVPFIVCEHVFVQQRLLQNVCYGKDRGTLGEVVT